MGEVVNCRRFPLFLFLFFDIGSEGFSKIDITRLVFFLATSFSTILLHQFGNQRQINLRRRTLDRGSITQPLRMAICACPSMRGKSDHHKIRQTSETVASCWKRWQTFKPLLISALVVTRFYLVNISGSSLNSIRKP